MTRVALFCCEYGAGRGNGVRMARIARVLDARGWACAFAVRPGGATHRALPPGARVLSAPTWDNLGVTLRKTGSSANMADILADLGLRSGDLLRAQITA
jgi:hypothetical protein